MRETPAQHTESVKRLGCLLSSKNPAKRAEGESLLREAASDGDRLQLLREAAQHEQKALTSLSLESTVVVQLSVLFMFFGFQAILRLGMPWYAAVTVFLLCLAVIVGMMVLAVRRFGDVRRLQAVTFELLKRDEPFAFQFLVNCWRTHDKKVDNEPVEQAITDWLTRYATGKPGEVLPEWAAKLGTQARGLFKVRKWRGKIVSVTPRGEFSDTRADLLVTLFQHLMQRPDIQTHERKKERELLEWAAQLQGTTENHAFVRDAAQALLHPKQTGVASGTTTTTPASVTLSPVAPSAPVMTVGQSRNS